jgi:hypothetical protein
MKGRTILGFGEIGVGLLDIGELSVVDGYILYAPSLFLQKLCGGL